MKIKSICLFLSSIVFLVIIVPLLFVVLTDNFPVASKQPLPENAEKKDIMDRILVYVKDQDKTVDMEFSEYLKGVVAGEMPGSFHIEAMKAQAVAARSFILARKAGYDKTGYPNEHKGAVICTDHTHCKAYLSKEVAAAKWGDSWIGDYWPKISDAVEQTKGLIMTYNSEPVNALFHSTSSGHTESSKDVWGGDVPYLSGVDSPGDKVSPKYQSQKKVGVEEFKNTILKHYPEAVFDDALMVTNIVRSNAGGIISADIGGVSLKGTEIRTMFELNSANITFKTEDGYVIMDVLGHGHGVGMSQYGANYLAQQGMGYVDILKTYYTGVEVVER